MAIVSISEAARLTGKARSTIQAQIKAGKLSKTTDSTTRAQGVDTSELMRVFGSLNTTSIGSRENVVVSQQTTADTALLADPEKEALKAEIQLLSRVLEEKGVLIDAQKKHIESLDNAMRLLEDQRQKTPQAQPEEPKGFLKRLFNF